MGVGDVALCIECLTDRHKVLGSSSCNTDNETWPHTRSSSAQGVPGQPRLPGLKTKQNKRIG